MAKTKHTIACLNHLNQMKIVTIQIIDLAGF